MKILDAQSAALSNPEVLAFLQANRPRTPDKRVGGYPSPDLQGYRSVHKEFDDYISRIAPHTRSFPPPEQWMKPLLSKLKPYSLTKTEVLMIINLGVGLNSADTSGQVSDTQDNGAVDGNGTNAEATTTTGTGRVDGDDTEMTGGDEEAGEEQGDEQVLNAVVEELDQRFNDEDVQAILNAVREAVRGSRGPGDAANLPNGGGDGEEAKGHRNMGTPRRDADETLDSCEIPEEHGS